VITKLQWSHGRLLNSAANFTKPEKNNKYFWVFEFFKQEQKETTYKAKSFWIFEYQTETRRYSKPILETKEANKEKQ
jgi:hypothetical protein